jgi:hypothetical protein
VKGAERKQEIRGEKREGDKREPSAFFFSELFDGGAPNK